MDTETARFWLLSGLFEIDAEEHEDAIRSFTRAIEVDPSLLRAWRGRAHAYWKTGGLDEAISDLDHAIELAPNSGDIWGFRGLAHLQRGDLDEAIDDLTRAIELEPESGRLWACRAEAQRQKGGLDEAIGDFGRAIAIDPNDGWSLTYRGYIHRVRGELAEAIADFTRAMKAPSWPRWARGARGEAYRLKGNLDKAAEDLGGADQTGPLHLEGAPWLEGPEAGYPQSVLGMAASEFADASSDPQSAWTWLLLGEVNRLRGNLDQAAADLTVAIQSRPNDPWLWIARAEANTLKGDLEEAIADFKRAIELEPEVDWAFWGLAQAYMTKGDREGAFAYLLRAVGAKPAVGEAGQGEARRRMQHRINRVNRIMKGFIPKSGPAIRVLIVDDIRETRSNIRKLLQFEDDIVIVGEAGTGIEGIRRFEELRPDVVCTNINMPEMDGITMTERICQRFPEARIFILSVMNEPNYMRRAILAGAIDFVAKPPLPGELVETIRRVAGWEGAGTHRRIPEEVGSQVGLPGVASRRPGTLPQARGSIRTQIRRSVADDRLPPPGAKAHPLQAAAITADHGGGNDLGGARELSSPLPDAVAGKTREEETVRVAASRAATARSGWVESAEGVVVIVLCAWVAIGIYSSSNTVDGAPFMLAVIAIIGASHALRGLMKLLKNR